MALIVPSAKAQGPSIGPAWATDVSATSARLHAQLTPGGLPTTYHFDYLTQAAYEANLAAAKEPFTGALKAPAGTDAAAGSGGSPVNVTQLLGGLKADSAYRYRVVAKSSAGTEAGSAHSLATFALGGALLADNRGWELVSPVDKNGGQADPPGAVAGGGLLQAAAQGGALTYSSASAFGQGAQGAPPASQYIAARSAGGWLTQNIATPLLSGSYADEEGVPYRLFSEDLSRALLLNGDHCRGGGAGCPVANPPLPGSGAPAGYQDYYLRTNATGAFAALLTSTDLAGQDPARFAVTLAGASPDLSHLVLSTCAALTANATEVPLGEGCDPQEQNLYLWSAGSALELINLLPAALSGTPGAKLAAPAGAISADGSRVYFTQGASLYLREGNTTEEVDAAAGGGGTFQTASAEDGAVAYFTKAGHLWRYGGATSTDLTPAGGVAGVLGASKDGAYAYFQDASALKLWHEGSTSTVAAGADASQATDSPPATGAARVSAAGTHLLFSSKAQLTGYDNTDQATGLPDAQLYLYDASAASLSCVSCNPANQRPLGPSSVPGAIKNGEGEGATIYKPRALSASGKRVFFDSTDSLAPPDTNNDRDVYQWEAQGEGSCAKAGGCISLISSGRSEEGASFADASADGSDAFFLTDASLVLNDPGSIDLYDARIGGGFPEPSPPIPCEGDACQVLPSEPVDPTLTTLLSGLGNPKVRYAERNKVPKKNKHHHHKKHKGHKGKEHGGKR